MSNKFHARKTQIDGIWFDSKAEGLHYLLLKDRQRKGEIRDLELQPKFRLNLLGQHIGFYTPDFLYVERGKQIAEDTKGVKTEAFQLRSKVFMALFPTIELRINGVASKRPKAAA